MYKKTIGYRLIAFMVDLIVVMMIAYLLNQLIGFGTLVNTEETFDLSLNWYEATIVFTLYFTVIEYVFYGQSVGKKTFSVFVKTEDGKDFVERKEYLIRGFAKGILILTAPVSFLVVLLGHERQSFHDMLVKTIVVRKVKDQDLIDIE